MAEATLTTDADAAEAKLDSRFRLWRLVTFLRWLTLVLGPLAILIDEMLVDWLVSMGFPAIVTMEDLSRWIILDVAGLSKWIDVDKFEHYYYMMKRINCFLFVIFLILAEVMKRRAVDSAANLAILQNRAIRGV